MHACMYVCIQIRMYIYIYIYIYIDVHTCVPISSIWCAGTLFCICTCAHVQNVQTSRKLIDSRPKHRDAKHSVLLVGKQQQPSRRELSESGGTTPKPKNQRIKAATAIDLNLKS